MLKAVGQAWGPQQGVSGNIWVGGLVGRQSWALSCPLVLTTHFPPILSPGFPDPQRMECHVQHPGYS